MPPRSRHPVGGASFGHPTRLGWAATELGVSARLHMMSDTGGSAQPGAEDLDALRRENTALRRQLEASQSTGGWRMVLAGVLVVLFGVALIPANQAVWLARTMLETDRFVTTFAPLPEDPAVAVALGQTIATSIAEQVQFEQRISSLLLSFSLYFSLPSAHTQSTHTRPHTQSTHTRPHTQSTHSLNQGVSILHHPPSFFSSLKRRIDQNR